MLPTKYIEFIRFGIVGVLATGIHYGIYILLNYVMIQWLAYSIGYGISFLCNFYLSSVFTFRSKASIKKGIGFSISHLINYLLHIVLLTIFLKLGFSDEIAPIPVFLIVIPINFLLVRFVFKSGKL
ncbi:GtrA family protein [Bacteroides caecigallinarum]|nr:GtrA family protein [Bacteroides caecigallinarum]